MKNVSGLIEFDGEQGMVCNFVFNNNKVCELIAINPSEDLVVCIVLSEHKFYKKKLNKFFKDRSEEIISMFDMKEKMNILYTDNKFIKYTISENGNMELFDLVGVK